jgi:hypothetical protein
MEYLQETTDWGNNTPNHIYIVNSAGQLAGYIKQGTTEEIWFKSPMKQWSKSKRKFKKLVDKTC